MEQELIRALGITNPMVNFHKVGVDFATTTSNANAFSITLQNAKTDGALTAVLFPGAKALFQSVAGTMVDGAFNDKTGTAGLSATSNESVNIVTLQSYLLRHATELKGIHFQFSNASQSAQSISLKEIDPFVEKPQRNLKSSTAFNQYSNNSNFLLLEADEIIGPDASIEYTLLSGAVGVPNIVTITFYFGGSFDESMMMRNFRNIAKGKVQQYGEDAITRTRTQLGQQLVPMGV